MSLGSLLQSGVGTIVASPWLFYFPAAVLTLLTLSMTLMADGLRDALDPNAANPTVTEPVEVAGAEPGGGR